MNKFKNQSGFIHFILLIIVVLIILYAFNVNVGHIWEAYIKPPIVAFLAWLKDFATGSFLDGLREKLNNQWGNNATTTN